MFFHEAAFKKPSIPGTFVIWRHGGSPFWQIGIPHKRNFILHQEDEKGIDLKYLIGSLPLARFQD